MNQPINPYEPAPLDVQESPKTSQHDPGARLTFLGAAILFLAAPWAVIMAFNLFNALFIGVDNFTLIYALIGCPYNLLVCIGALNILRKRSYQIARITCWMAMVPVLGPCMYLGIILGIYGLILFRKPAIRAAFAKR